MAGPLRNCALFVVAHLLWCCCCWWLEQEWNAVKFMPMPPRNSLQNSPQKGSSFTVRYCIFLPETRITGAPRMDDIWHFQQFPAAPGGSSGRLLVPPLLSTIAANATRREDLPVRPLLGQTHAIMLFLLCLPQSNRLLACRRLNEKASSSGGSGSSSKQSQEQRRSHAAALAAAATRAVQQPGIYSSLAAGRFVAW